MARYDKLDLPVKFNNYEKATDVPVPPAECSWLGRWQDVGWAIRITPRLGDSDWKVFELRAEETWDPSSLNYDAMKSLELLGELFPRCELSLVWPRCGKRTVGQRTARIGRVPAVEVCGAMAKHTDTHIKDVTGARVGIARCDAHQGQL